MKAGDYVRTKKAILQIIDNRPFIDVADHKKYFVTNGRYTSVLATDIIKSSPNIIDLIEVGDYVNGKKVAVNCKVKGGNMVLFTDMDCANEKGIKSIVTREQFESMEYKVEK